MVNTEHVDAIRSPNEFIAGTAVGRVPAFDVLSGADVGEVLEVTEGFITFGQKTIWAIRACHASERKLGVVVLSGVGEIENGWVSGRLRSGEGGDEDEDECGEDGIEEQHCEC